MKTLKLKCGCASLKDDFGYSVGVKFCDAHFLEGYWGGKKYYERQIKKAERAYQRYILNKCGKSDRIPCDKPSR